MPLRIVLAAAILATFPPAALAQAGGGVPSNPFASNYPSVPPGAAVTRRERRAVHPPARKPRPPARSPR